MNLAFEPVPFSLSGRCAASLGIRWGKVPGLAHLQGSKDEFLSSLIEGEVSDLLNEFAHQDESHVAINKLLSGFGIQLEVEDFLKGDLFALLVVLHWIVGHESRAVSQDVLDRDGIL